MSNKGSEDKKGAPDLISLFKGNPVLALASFLGIALLLSLAVYQANIDRDAKTDQQQKIEQPIEEDAWEARLRREREEWDKKQEQEINALKESRATSNPDSSDVKRNKVASMIVAVSCGGGKGLMPRSQMGSMLKQMLESEGINATVVFENWDYYWSRAVEMDKYNKTYCIQ